MTFKASLANIKLDLTDLVFYPEGGSGGITSEFEITAKDFLKYAKEDLHAQDERSIINSLSNSKRAIDCKIDEVLDGIGVNYLDLPKSLEPFVNYFDNKVDIPYKLRIIQGLNLAPSLIIAKARTLRNQLEHHYKIPTIDEVRESIDIADLFIRSINGKLDSPLTEFVITDRNNLTYREGLNDGFNDGIEISFEFNKITVRMRRSDKVDNTENFTITPDEPEYFGLIRLMNSRDDDFELSESFKLIANLIGHDIPLKHIKIEAI